MLNIGACGIDCGNCAAYKATQANDVTKLAELAVSWSSEKNKWKAADMCCDGCTSSRVFKGCKECAVRTCAQDKSVGVCSRCGDYPCDKLEGMWKGFGGDVTTYKANLEKAK
ncbi:TPA: DUF3795 domain-containing protein [Candidatus Bathyarchaeota archaeon]|nr:DUF3795 domain-containing protein [Candidatus Bathyarchaeota archaeon]